MHSSTFLLFSLSFLGSALAFNISRNDNLAVYWGQSDNQKPLSFYCQDDTIDIIPIAFLTEFFGTGDAPTLDLAKICNPTNHRVFPSTSLADCGFMAKDIKACQAKGKAVTLSLGGATGVGGFTSDQQAQKFADQVYDIFLGGSSDTRPFGDAVLDGIDLDVEGGTSEGYAAFVDQIRVRTKNAKKKYYITAAPQCPYPDLYMGKALNQASFDAVFVQFYNNDCAIDGTYNYAEWEDWAKNKSPNKEVKIYIGAPGSPKAANNGYTPINTLKTDIGFAKEKFSSFGGVMLWDAYDAYTNDRYDVAVKQSLTGSAASKQPPAPSKAPYPPKAASSSSMKAPLLSPSSLSPTPTSSSSKIVVYTSSPLSTVHTKLAAPAMSVKAMPSPPISSTKVTPVTALSSKTSSPRSSVPHSETSMTSSSIKVLASTTSSSEPNALSTHAPHLKPSMSSADVRTSATSTSVVDKTPLSTSLTLPSSTTVSGPDSGSDTRPLSFTKSAQGQASAAESTTSLGVSTTQTIPLSPLLSPRPKASPSVSAPSVPSLPSSKRPSPVASHSVPAPGIVSSQLPSPTVEAPTKPSASTSVEDPKKPEPNVYGMRRGVSSQFDGVFRRPRQISRLFRAGVLDLH